MIQTNKNTSYKPAKTLDNQIEYLHNNKRVQFNEMCEEEAKEKLLKYNYINVITPFKHHFATLDQNRQVLKVDQRHVYDRDVEFMEYYNYFLDERKKYPIMIKNILEFEITFKSILSYRIVTEYTISNSNELIIFLDLLKLNCSNMNKYGAKRIMHMNEHIDNLKTSVNKYADIYCFFDRISLGDVLVILTCLNYSLQDQIFLDLKTFNLVFGVNKVQDFIEKVFCLVSIRNCVMHGNSLEILVRFYNPKTHTLRKASDKRKYTKMISLLSIEKTIE